MMKVKISSILFILFSGLIATGCSNTLDTGESDQLSATISYQLPEETHVKLWVENSYKTTIVILADEVQQAGMHTSVFEAVDANGNNLPEGVYTYRIETEFYSQSRMLRLFYD